MRRSEKEFTDQAAIAQVLDGAEWGVLGLVSPGGTPLLVPLNYVYFQERIYFHGAPAGEKMETLAVNGQATFLVVDAYAQIPSHVFDAQRACPATQYFKSVLLYGRVGIVGDLDRKAEVLQALMEKLQPEGGFRPITAADPMYHGSVKGVAILEFTVERSSAKVEVGQRLTADRRESVLRFLEKRGGEVDLRTLKAMADPGSPSPS